MVFQSLSNYCVFDLNKLALGNVATFTLTFTLKATSISIGPSNIKVIIMIFTAFRCLMLLILIVNFVTLVLIIRFIILRLAVKFIILVIVKITKTAIMFDNLVTYRPHLMV